MAHFQLAMIQMHSEFGEVESNVRKAEKMAREARANGAVLICLPESFSCGYYCLGMEEMLRYAQRTDGPTVRRFQALAKELGAYLIVPIIESAEDGSFRNTAVLIDDFGQVVGQYSKCHLTDAEKPFLTPGSELKTFDTRYGKIGILICHDISFPEAARVLALRGAQVIVCPLAWRDLSFYRDWLIQAMTGRALENVLFTASAAMAGRDLPESPFTGTSLFAGPRGKILAKAGIDEETILYHLIDLDVLRKEREENTCLADRRPECYGILCDTAVLGTAP